MSKNLRQTKILNLVRSYPILSQTDLARKLKAQGFSVTQATLSRDLRELNLIKTSRGYQPPGHLKVPENNHNQQRHTIVQFMIEVKAAGNLVVVKTNPGNAGPVARSLDTIAWPEIVGTVAGDDTILVVTSDAPAADAVKKRLLGLAS
jgi:transcriptional regulator of arginine metabolism